MRWVSQFLRTRCGTGLRWLFGRTHPASVVGPTLGGKPIRFKVLKLRLEPLTVCRDDPQLPLTIQNSIWLSASHLCCRGGRASSGCCVKKKRLGEVLTEKGYLSEHEIEHALASQGDGPARLGEILAESGLVSKSDLGASLEEVNGMAYCECPPAEIDPEVLAKIPPALAARSCALPVAVQDKTLIVVMGEPQNMAVLEELEFAASMPIEPRFSFRSDVVAGIRKFYDQEVKAAPNHDHAAPAPPEPAPGRMSRMAAAALLIGCGIAAVGTWKAAALVFETVGGTSDVVVETVEPVVGAGDIVAVAGDAPPPAPQPPAVDPVASASWDESVSSARDSNPGSMSPVTQHLPGRAAPEDLREEAAGAQEAISPTGGLSAEIQVGTFRIRANAQRLADTLAGSHDRVEMSVSGAGLYVVSLGPFPDKQDADRIAGEIRAETGLIPLVRLSSLE